DIMDGKMPSGRVVVFDDDHFYMGGVIAELLALRGAEVTLVTPSAFVSEWTRNTLEQAAIHKRLAETGVSIVLNRGMTEIGAGYVVTNCVFTGAMAQIGCDAVAMVASRLGRDGLWRNLKARENEWTDAGIRSVKLIGDADAPGPIAWATYAGHRYARELDADDIGDAMPFRRELAELARE
ncbi:MAG TPA: NADH:flavin oxidoreductase, partial [Rhizobiaceae bacterium]|nr:NADH:flavin oxidoreductase [Rhizobiaceae bacterium]